MKIDRFCRVYVGGTERSVAISTILLDMGATRDGFLFRLGGVEFQVGPNPDRSDGGDDYLGAFIGDAGFSIEVDARDGSVSIVDMVGSLDRLTKALEDADLYFACSCDYEDQLRSNGRRLPLGRDEDL